MLCKYSQMLQSVLLWYLHDFAAKSWNLAAQPNSRCDAAISGMASAAVMNSVVTASHPWRNEAPEQSGDLDISPIHQTLRESLAPNTSFVYLKFHFFFNQTDTIVFSLNNTCLSQLCLNRWALTLVGGSSGGLVTLQMSVAWLALWGSKSSRSLLSLKLNRGSWKVSVAWRGLASHLKKQNVFRLRKPVQLWNYVFNYSKIKGTYFWRQSTFLLYIGRMRSIAHR